MQKLLHTQFPKLLMLVVLLFGMTAFGQQTFYNMATGNYSQDFANISGWENNYATGVGATNWRVASAPINNTTVFATSVSGGVQKGNENMILLATGANTAATDLLLNFTNRDAGTISVKWAKVINSVETTPRTSDFKIQYSVDNGSTFTDLTGYTIPRVTNNSTAQNGSLTNIVLPAAITNKAQVVLRFFVWNNTQTTGSGNRPKFSIDDISVTSTSSGPAVTTTTATPTTTGATINGTINAYDTATTASFNHGTSTSYGSTVAATPSSVTGTSLTNISATLSGLLVNTRYYFRAVGVTATATINGDGVSFYTLANTPGAPVVTGATYNSLNVALNTTTQNSNPSATQYAIQVGSQYVQSSTGALGALASWATAETWGTKTVVGLAESTLYTFSVKAKNGDNVETGFGATAQGTTLANTNPRYTATALTTFGTLCINTSVVRDFTLTGSYLNGDVTVGPRSGYTFATATNGEYASSLTIVPASGSINTTIYVKLTPATAVSYDGNISVSGGGANAINVAVTGSAVNTPGTITATTSTAVLSTTATLGSNITSEGCSSVSRGVVYGTTSTPAIGGSGVTQLTSSATSTGTFTVAATNLNPATTYYARAYATNNGGTVYGTQVIFTTACAALSLPFNEGFEATTFPPACWARYRGTNGLGTTNDWIRSTTDTYNSSAGTALARFESVTNGQLAEDWLVTPALIIPNNGSRVKLKFQERQAYSELYSTNYYIKVSTTSQTSHATFTNVISYTENDFSTDYSERVIDLSAYAGQTIFVAFVMSQNDGDSWYVDNISVKEEVAPPVATAATNIMPHNFTANWNSVTNATGYELDVATSVNFVETIISENFSGFGTSSSNIASTLNTYTQTPGWTGVNVYANTGTARIGVGAASGSITTPTINLSGNGGNATLNYKLLRWGNDSNISVQILHAADGTNFVQVGSNITVPLSSVDLSIAITNGTANSKIRFQAAPGATDTRFVIDNISIVSSGILPQYNSLPVNATSASVTGLLQNTTYYYRVRATGLESTSPNSNTIEVKTGKELVWNGTQWTDNATPTTIDSGSIEAAYNTLANGNFTIGQLTVAPTGLLTVATGTTVTVTNGITNNAGAAGFTVQNNGALVQTNSTVNTGAVKVIKNSHELYRLDYTLWASPVSGQTLGAFSPETSAGRMYEYKYDLSASTNAYAEQYFTVDPATEFASAKGYLIRMPNGNSTVSGYNTGATAYSYEGTFTGVPHNGTVTIPTTAGSAYTAVGNPYASPISVVDFFAANTGVMNTTSGIYFWRKRNNNLSSSYATLTLAAYTANGGYAPNQAIGGGEDQASFYTGDASNWNIAQGQGFFVKNATAPTGTSITFTNSMRKPSAGATQSFLRTAASTTSRLWLNLTNNQNGFSQTAIAYIDNATTGIDYGYDAEQLIDNGNVTLYSVNSNVNLAIQARPAFTVNDVVPMGFTAANAGQYTFAVDHTDGVFTNGQEIYLKDNLTGTTQSITNTAYTFTTQAGTFNNRLEVVYTTEALNTNTPVLNAGSVIVYKQDQTINISSALAEITDVTIYDVRGRQLYSANGINKTEVSIAGLQVAHEVIIVEINTVKGKVSKKVVY